MSTVLVVLLKSAFRNQSTICFLSLLHKYIINRQIPSNRRRLSWQTVLNVCISLNFRSREVIFSQRILQNDGYNFWLIWIYVCEIYMSMFDHRLFLPQLLTCFFIEIDSHQQMEFIFRTDYSDRPVTVPRSRSAFGKVAHSAISLLATFFSSFRCW